MGLRGSRLNPQVITDLKHLTVFNKHPQHAQAKRKTTRLFWPVSWALNLSPNKHRSEVFFISFSPSAFLSCQKELPIPSNQTTRTASPHPKKKTSSQRRQPRFLFSAQTPLSWASGSPPNASGDLSWPEWNPNGLWEKTPGFGFRMGEIPSFFFNAFACS